MASLPCVQHHVDLHVGLRFFLIIAIDVQDVQRHFKANAFVFVFGFGPGLFHHASPRVALADRQPLSRMFEYSLKPE